MQAFKSWLSNNLATLQQFGGLWVALGVTSLILTLIALPAIVLRLPADYFVDDKRVPVTRTSRHPLMVLAATVAKNLFGLMLIAIGAILLFIPGQGLLTMLIGVLLTNFPGKYRLERSLVRRPAVLRTLNRIRSRAGQEPLQPPDYEDKS